MVDTVGASTYRLHAPQRQVYDPSTLEQLYAKELFTPGTGGLAVGYLLGAEADRRQSAADYSLALDAVNEQQGRIAQQRMAADLQQAQLKLVGTAMEHPSYASAFPAVTSQMHPGAVPQMVELSGHTTAQRGAQASREQAQANQANTEAGVMPAPGTPFDAYGRPEGVRTQGVPLDLLVARENSRGQAAGQGGVRLGNAVSLANAYAARAEFVSKQTNEIEGRMIASRGGRYDAQNNMWQAPHLTPAERQQIRNDAKAEAEAAADLAYGSMAHVLGNAGYSNLVPPNTVPGTPGYVLAPNRRTGGTVAIPGDPGTVRIGPDGKPIIGDSTTRPPPGAGGATAAPPPPPEDNPVGTNTQERLGSMDRLRASIARQGKVPDSNAFAQRVEAERRRVGGVGYRPFTDGSIGILNNKSEVIFRVVPQ